MLSKNRGTEIGREFFVYSSYVASIASGATASDSINFDTDSVFVWTQTAYKCTIAAAAQTSSSIIVPNVNLLITKSGSGTQMMDKALPIPSIAGADGGLPFVLAQPTEFEPRQKLTFSYTSIEASVTIANLFVMLIGYKVYYSSV